MVDHEDAKRALDSYLRSGEGASSSSGSKLPIVVGKLGVKSTWFLGVDVVTHNPIFPNK